LTLWTRLKIRRQVVCDSARLESSTLLSAACRARLLIKARAHLFETSTLAFVFVQQPMMLAILEVRQALCEIAMLQMTHERRDPVCGSVSGFALPGE
jgi:hypothetical protein